MARKLPWDTSVSPPKPAATSVGDREDRALKGDLPKTLGKRKRGQEDAIKLASRHRRIFEDMVFYFFPNSDISPARNAKIRKAIEFGASWKKDWGGRVTHIISDSDVPYQALLKFLKLEHVPDEIVLVTEKYVSDCLSLREILDPDKRYYKPNDYYQVTKQPLPQRGMKYGPMEDSRSRIDAALSPREQEVHLAKAEPERVGIPEAPPVVESLAVDRAGEQQEEPIATSQYQDDLEAAIGETKAVEHLPLDEEDEDAVSHAVSSGSDTESDDEKILQSGLPETKKGNWQDKFQCMQKHDGSTPNQNPNVETIKILEEMCSYYDRTRDHWRTLAYRRAIATLRNQDHKILTQSEARQLPNIGERLAAKIEEIVWTKRLRRLENAQLDPNEQIMSTFTKIYGVGLSQASRWLSRGYRTLRDLESHARLTDNQKIGIAHYDDFLARIPRDEVTQHGEIVQETLRGIDSSFEVHIMGSYRRGATTSGDIDLLITKPGASTSLLRTVVFEDLIPQLFKIGFLTASLATRRSSHDGSKFHGASALPGSTVWRRIDLLLVPWSERGAALIYFTGNDIFNRSLRLLASKKGMRLNQRGLYKDVLRRSDRSKITQGTLVEGEDEKKIFEHLGVPWRPPCHRIC